MEPLTFVPLELEILIKDFEIRIKDLSNEEKFDELMNLKLIYERSFYLINKYLGNYGMSVNRYFLEENGIEGHSIQIEFLSPLIEKKIKEKIVPFANLENKRRKISKGN